MKQQFDISILSQNWVPSSKKDFPLDLCSHGEVYLKIGDSIMSDKEAGQWTLSSTALYLMRTLFNDYNIGDYESQLIPCCGHFFIPSENEQSVKIIGCSNGVDWNIKHLEKNQIRHTTVDGEVGIISKEAYQKLVTNFVHQVEEFYNENEPKIIPEDEYERKGYGAFWNEWNTLKQKIETR